MSYDTMSHALAKYFLGDYPAATDKDADALAQVIQDAVEDWLSAEYDAKEGDLEPCTAAAQRAGCTCFMSVVHATDIDPPEPVRDRDCPIHGDCDGDDRYDLMREEERYRD